jgi:type II secretory pathway component PulC
MKNKKIIISLVLLTVAVWGTIIFRIVKSIHLSDTVAVTNTEPASNKLIAVADTFSIKGDYRDPFLGRRIIASLPKKIQAAPVKPKPLPVVATINWPNISYSGIIKNQNSTRELALIKVDQKDFIMKTGDVAKGVELNKIFKDSVIVFYQREKKTVIK